jgi:cell fate regulator YaaT (PSP1 superfamily)
MGCGSCSTGGDGTPRGCKNNGTCSSGGCNKLNVFNWLANMELPNNQTPFDMVEVRFKNGRKEFFKNHENLPIYVGDVVAVEASPGHDIGVVSLTGELVRIQMQKKKTFGKAEEVKKLYRKAKENDIEKWKEGQRREAEGMPIARRLAIELNLSMKISDIEFQGDLSKAIFYYTADERVDFRELIKKLAEAFKVRIEMRQIGMRQEAGRLGGIGSCGRELCCSTWLTDFRSVSTSAARYQQLSLNPMKLAGQCGKLKCCLNFELDAYMDELKAFPDIKKKLKTTKGDAFYQKMDIFGNKMWYSYFDEPGKFIELTLDRVNEIIAMNAEGKTPSELIDLENIIIEVATPDYANVVGQDDLTRFDRQKKAKKKRKKRPAKAGNNPNQDNVNKGPRNQQDNGDRPKNNRPKRNKRPNNARRNENDKNNTIKQERAANTSKENKSNKPSVEGQPPKKKKRPFKRKPKPNSDDPQ